MLSDLKFAFRQLLKNPGFTAVAVGSLAVGFALSAVTFATVNAYLLRSVPYPTAHRVYHVRYAPIGPYEPRGMTEIDWKALGDVIADSITASGQAFVGSDFRPGWTGVHLESVHDRYVQNIRPVLVGITLAVLIVLVLACINVAVLMLLRAMRRQKEIAVRVALGAKPKHLLGMLIF